VSTVIDLRHLHHVPILCTVSRRAGWQQARQAGFRPRDVHQALTATTTGWVIGYRIGDLRHWALMADTQTMIIAPAGDDPAPADAEAQPTDSGWRTVHRSCQICDWNRGAGYRRLTPAAWAQRTQALLPKARDGAEFVPAVRDHLVVALRMHQTGRLNDAAYWLGCAEQAATPEAARRRRSRSGRSAHRR
jgi:hypothetical protein